VCSFPLGSMPRRLQSTSMPLVMFSVAFGISSFRTSRLHSHVARKDTLRRGAGSKAEAEQQQSSSSSSSSSSGSKSEADDRGISALIWVSLETAEPEALMEFLLGVGASSASARPSSEEFAMEVNHASPTDRAPLWKHSTVTAIFEETADLRQLAEAVRIAFDLPVAPAMRVEPLDAKRDWIMHVQKNWSPLKLAGSFQVLLPWHDGPSAGCRNKEDRIVLRLEGGTAFGLGDHPTTQGGAAFLERMLVRTDRQDSQSPRVLDYGTGSGILAIVAERLGSRSVVGVDVDSPSVASARRNAAMNCSEESALDFYEGPEDFTDAHEFAQGLAETHGQFDIVVANILCRPLMALAPTLAAAAKHGAALALTGLRSEIGDFQRIKQAYQDKFFDFHEVQLDGGWILVEATRR